MINLNCKKGTKVTDKRRTRSVVRSTTERPNERIVVKISNATILNLLSFFLTQFPFFFLLFLCDVISAAFVLPLLHYFIRNAKNPKREDRKVRIREMSLY